MKKIVSLGIMNLCVKSFCSGGEHLSASDISLILGIPLRLANNVLFDLTNAGLLSEINEDNDKKCYQPAECIDKMSISYVLEKLERYGNNDIPINKTKEIQTLTEYIDIFNDKVKNIAIGDI